MDKKPTSAAIKGLLIGLVLIVFSLVVAMSGQMQNTWLGSLSYVIFIAGIAWAISSYAKQINYNSTFGGYFKHGFAATAIITCLLIVFTAVYFTMDPSIKEMAIEKSTEQMREKQIPEEAINQGLEITRKYFVTLAVLGTLFTYLLLGVIVSLITAAIVKKNPQLIGEETEDFLNHAN